jgi:2-haloacid dehalogenase
MKAYDALSTFPDVPPALKELENHGNILPVVFSNGTSAMVSTSIQRSPDLSRLSSVLKKLVVVEKVKRYKPAPAVYEYLAEQVGKKNSEMGHLWLVSGNPFDVVGARSVGMKAAWIDRPGKGWIDSLDYRLQPTVIVRSLEGLVETILKHIQK